MPKDNLLRFKTGWLIREGLHPNNKSHDLPKVGLILMILGYLAWIYVVWEHYIFAKLITNLPWMLGFFLLMHRIIIFVTYIMSLTYHLLFFV